MRKTVTFDKPYHISGNLDSPYLDDLEYGFRFQVVQSDFIGKPREKSKTTNHTIKVKITEELQANWHLRKTDIVKVLFERVKEHVNEKIRKNTLLEREELKLLTSSEEDECPFNIVTIQDPTNGIRYEIDVEEENDSATIRDVLIVTVTKVESKAVIDVFNEASGQVPKPIPIGDRVYHDFGIVNGTRVFMVQSEMGASGLGASQQAVQKGIVALSPIAVIMVGIAFGINAEKQSIGDILVSQRLSLYEFQRIGTQNGEYKIVLRGDRPHASPWLYNRFQSAELHWKESATTVKFGIILSGEKLVDNVDFRQQLLQLEPEAIGGEMEGTGLYVACQDSKVDWILVKAICDWADGHKSQDKDRRQQLAAHNAARFLLHTLQFAPLKADKSITGNLGVFDTQPNSIKRLNLLRDLQGSDKINT